VDWESAARFLFDLLDDIDTLGDSSPTAESYRKAVELVQRRRFEVAGTDGYTVTFKPVPPSPEAVEPPPTCSNPYCDNGLIRPDTTFGRTSTSPCPDCRPVESSQEGSETGGEKPVSLSAVEFMTQSERDS